MRWAIVFLLVFSTIGEAETIEEVAIRKRGLLPTTDSLRVYLRTLCPAEGTKERVDAYIRDLFSDDAAQRDYGTNMLAREGPVALGALQQHMANARPEVRRRLRALIERAKSTIRSNPIAEVYAVIAYRGVSGLAPEVLRTLPLVQDAARATGRNALIATSTRTDAALLLKAMREGDPELRAAAIQAYGKVMESDAVDVLLKLSRERSPNIRVAVALALARQKHTESLVLLVDLLDCSSGAIRFRCVRLLRAISGKRFGFAAYAAADARAAGVESWRTWLVSADRKVTWSVEGLALGGMRQRILISSGAAPVSTITEIDLQGRVHRQHTVKGYVQGIFALPNGNALVSLWNQCRVEEYDALGQRVWSSKRLQDRPRSVQRLANGNTLIAFPRRGWVQEITEDSGVAWSADLVPGTYFAIRLPSGITRVSNYTQRRIFDLDRRGKRVRAVSVGGQPFMAQSLDAGGFLVCFPQANRVSLVDKKGKTGQSWGGFQRPTSAYVLPDGDIIVGDSRGVHRLSRAGGKKTLFRTKGDVWISYY